MFKKLVTLSSVLLCTGLSSLPLQAEDVDLIITARTTASYQDDSIGNDLIIRLSYDSNTLSRNAQNDYPDMPYTGYEFTAVNSAISLEYAGTQYWVDASPYDLLFTIDVNNSLSETETDKIEINTQGNYFNQGNGGHDITDLRINFESNGLTNASLPDNSEIYHQGVDAFGYSRYINTVHFYLPGQSREVRANITGVYQQAIPGCQRQTKYNFEAELTTQYPDPSNPEVISGTLTLNPRKTTSVLDHYGTDSLEDSGLSSGFTIDMYGKHYSSSMQTEVPDYPPYQSGPLPLPSVTIHKLYPNMVDMNGSHPLTSHDGEGEPIYVNLILQTDELQAELFPLVQSNDPYDSSLLRISSNGETTEARITKFELDDGACSVRPKVIVNSYSYDYPDQGPSYLARVPEQGPLYVHLDLVNDSDSEATIDYWATIEFPSGQIYPHGDASSEQIDPKDSHRVPSKELHIPAHWPVGYYRYTVHTLSRDSKLMPQKASMLFVKEWALDPEPPVPPPAAGSFYEESFDNAPLGLDPSHWLDTAAGNKLTEDNSLFLVISAGSTNAFGTDSTATNIHSHLTTGPFGATNNAYEYSGKMRMSQSGAGIGVTFFSKYPESDRYYRLRRWSGKQNFHLSAHGTSIGGDINSDVFPEKDKWYRFKILVDGIDSTQTTIKAKIWLDGQSEPAEWQIDAYDSSSSRLNSGKIGVWSMGVGEKYWDDFLVQP